MLYTQAFLIHSWFTWATFNSIVNSLASQPSSILLILSRGFELPQNSRIYRAVRFEYFESRCLSDNISLEPQDLTCLGLFADDIIKELVLPHIGYRPFHCLASLTQIYSLSFYQESLQLPAGILTYRDASILLNSPGKPSLFLSYDPRVLAKQTFNYYNLGEQRLPLYLRSIVVDDLQSSLLQHLPDLETHNPSYDFCLIAGKAMNHDSGYELICSIIKMISYLNPRRVMFKASPSTSDQLNKKVIRLSNDINLQWVSGHDSIEKLILSGKIKVIISENFTLSAIARLVDGISVISIEKTITNDFPSLKSNLTERASIPIFEKYFNSQISLSEYLLSQLKDP